MYARVLHSIRQVWQTVRFGRVHAASEQQVLQAEQDFYSAYITANMIVFDVGANVGDLTLRFSQLASQGAIHAFEASAATFTQLTDRCRASGCSNITLNHLALSDHQSTVTLHVYDDEHSGWNTMARRPLDKYGINIRPVHTEAVTATTVDAYCTNHAIGTIDLLKIDVEGAEYQVLLGARQMLEAKRIRCCTFEFGGTTFDMGNRPGAIERYLEELGYRIQNVVPGDPVFPGRFSAMAARFSMHTATPLP